jgi:hypothetical protein
MCDFVRDDGARRASRRGLNLNLALESVMIANPAGFLLCLRCRGAALTVKFARGGVQCRRRTRDMYAPSGASSSGRHAPAAVAPSDDRMDGKTYAVRVRKGARV